MQLVFFDLLLQECYSLLIELVLVLESLHNTITNAINLLEMTDLAMTLLDEDLLLGELAVLAGNLVVVLVDDAQQLLDFLQGLRELEIDILELYFFLILLNM